jgi:hypothetical protein
MSYKPARRETIRELSDGMKSVSAKYPDAASRLFKAITDESMALRDIDEFAQADPKALRQLALMTAGMSDECFKFMLSFILTRGLLLSYNTSAVIFDLRIAAVIAPLVSEVPFQCDSQIENMRDHAKQMNGASTIIAACDMKASMGTLKTGLQLVTGTHFKLNNSEKDFVRGHYMHKCSGDLISLEDREWFGANVEALLPVWSRFTDTGNFSRGYAEQVLTGAAEHGTALLDGVL